MGGYSETFIRAHIEKLPTEVIVLYGRRLPLSRESGESISAFRLFSRIGHAYPKTPVGRSVDYLEKRSLQRFLVANHVKLVLAEYGVSGLVVMEACAGAGIPLVVHFHGYDAYRESVLQGVGRQYPQLFQEAAAIVAVSRHMENQLLHLGAPANKLHYNPCGVDLDMFREAQPSTAPPTFLAVGRFVNKKAPYLSLLAFSQVNKEVPEARLQMIGDGELLETCQRLAKALGIADAVEFCGAQPHSIVAKAMAQARAFVQHSVKTDDGDSEGTPVAILEAGASGLPVVATRHTGIVDTVVHGETGFLTDEGDVDTMAEYLMKLALEPETAARLGEAARTRIQAKFSMDRSISRLWEILARAMNLNAESQITIGS
jgi:glycosyltransferase involved in cell wall biosynthesis